MTPIADKALRLGVIGAVAALLLALVNNFTEPVIAELREKELQEALSSLAGGGIPGEASENPAPGVARRWSVDGAEGWILELKTVGYNGTMIVVASYAADGRVEAARLMDNDETVGFGKRAEKPGYMDIFVGTGGDTPVPRNKGNLGDRADVVSGATITFSGIAEAIAKGSDLVKGWSAVYE